MELTLNWLVEGWGAISTWASTQPIFVQVAFGMGLFYLILQLWHLFFRVSLYVVSALFSGRERVPKKKDPKPPIRSQKPAPLDDDAPPFVFR
ncbi:MAG: hypothetical protein R3274_03440 [Desulfobacterales bacterium]|nr:hypothetical protein [Desulfobacterales bacterium]